MTANDHEISEHDMLYATSRGGQHWAECECGWISGRFRAERYAVLAHENHAKIVAAMRVVKQR